MYLKIKRVFDILFAATGLLLLWPVFLLIAILIKIESKGSVFYCQNRVGKNGKIFFVYKFRTMIEGAEDILCEYLEQNTELLQEYKVYHKLKRDGRVTKTGYFLRKISIDELPQLFNVLKDEMSLIGPRPYTLKEIESEDMDTARNIILSCMPGITGYWQVNGRNNTTHRERIQMETFYAQNISWKMDVKIFLKTFLVILKQEGAA